MPLEHTLPPSVPRAVLTARRLVAQIMQGRITKVLNMKPQEILGLIEEAAGTRMFELKKQQAVKTIEKKETKLAEIDKVFEEDLTPRLEKLGSERAEYLEYKKSEQDVETLSRVCQAHDYFSSERAQQKCTEALEEGKARQVELAKANPTPTPTLTPIPNPGQARPRTMQSGGGWRRAAPPSTRAA